MRSLLLVIPLFVFIGCSGQGQGGSPATDGNSPMEIVVGATPQPGASPAVMKLHAPGCKPWAPLAQVGGNITFTPVFSGLTQSIGEPVALVQAPGDSSTWYMIELYGRLSSFPAEDNVNANDRKTVLDMTGVVYAENEAGMLSVAVDPCFATNRRIYTSYTTTQANNPNAYTLHVARTTLASDGTATSATPETIFSIPEPYNFHIGGHIAFGADGYLYIGAGMADTSNDPTNHAQDLTSPYGKVLRLDVSQSQAQTFGSYGIPTNNPFVGNASVLPEIYAYGFRNPWQFTFDRATGQLWLGDVGENAWEEIDTVTAGRNYGWPDFEGPSCNPNAQANQGGTAGCDAITSVAPQYAYRHDGTTAAYGDCVVGGFVYRGSNLPDLEGSVIFSDCITGTIWALKPDANGNPNIFVTLGQPDAGVLAFGQDNRGEIYFVDRLAAFTRIDPEGVASTVQVPTTLTATGCFDDANSMTPVAGVLPYSVSVPFWSDGADKNRFIALPEGTTMGIDANAHITLPVGTMLVKNFMRNGQPVETRIYAHQQDGTWSPYSYAWKAGVSTLVPATGSDVVLADGTSWHYPSQAQCLSCHNAASGYNLGWQVGQINTTQDYGDGKAVNQLQAYDQWGLLAGGVPSDAAHFVSPADANNSLEARARSYLQVNCAMCHQPGGQGLGVADLRITTPNAGLGICNTPPSYGDFGLTNAAVLVPGSHASSVLSYRMHATDAARMPAVSSDVVDPNGTQVIDAWIDSLTACPQ